MTEETDTGILDQDEIAITISRSQLWQATLSIFETSLDLKAAFTVFMAALTAIDPDDGAILIDKEKLAKSKGYPLELLEEAMADLATIGVFEYSDRGERSFDGLCMNPRVAWTGTDKQKAYRMWRTRPLRGQVN